MHSIPKRETTRAADTFAEYAAMGTGRSLAKLYTYLRQTPGKPQVNLSTLEDWSRAHHWQQRVREHDRAQVDARQARYQAEIEKMSERHILIALAQQKRAIEQIEALIAAKKFSSMAAVTLLKFAIALEREARGTPISMERHEISNSNDPPLLDTSTIDDDHEAERLARALIARITDETPTELMRPTG
jgi:hypothetical protein